MHKRTKTIYIYVYIYVHKYIYIYVYTHLLLDTSWPPIRPSVFGPPAHPPARLSARPPARPPAASRPAGRAAGQPASICYLDIWPFMYLRCWPQSYYQCLLAPLSWSKHMNSCNRAFLVYVCAHMYMYVCMYVVRHVSIHTYTHVYDYASWWWTTSYWDWGLLSTGVTPGLSHVPDDPWVGRRMQQSNGHAYLHTGICWNLPGLSAFTL